jgi:tellurite resistance protein TerC
VMLVGIKMLVVDFYKIPVLVLLSTIIVILTTSIVASLYIKRPHGPV